MAIVKPKKKRCGDMVTGIFINFLLIVVIFVSLYPFWHVVMYSLSDSRAAMSGGLFLWPRQFTLLTYKLMFETTRIFVAFRNSIAKTVIGTIISVVVTVLVAYPLSREELRGRKMIQFLFYFTMLFSGGIIPTYMLIKDLELLDTFWVYVIPGAVNVYNMFILRSAFLMIPRSLPESAMLDGANPIRILCYIILPLSRATIATITLYYVQGNWNSYMDGVLYVNDSKLELLQVYMRRLISQAGAAAALNEAKNLSAASMVTEESTKMTVIAFSIIPVIIVYMFLQKYFMKGVTIGAVKG